ncbi:MAG: SHOCT domain-containing protein [Bacteroidetes bacterium]|nr:SHOCT domain-containing protein [Bacteroidota bacterium]
MSKTLRIKLVFDKAINGFNGFPPEILVPEEFKINSKGNNAEELQKFYKLFENGIITKEEFEKQKKMILENKMD